MEPNENPSPPKGLRRRGRALWRVLHERLEYDPHEAELVLETCRTVDAIESLQSVIDRDGYTVAGSTGQTIVHPAVAELRQQQVGLTRLLTTLNLTAALEGTAGAVGLSRATSDQASAAANARWSRSRAQRA